MVIIKCWHDTLGIARQTARNIVIWFRQRGDVNLGARGGAHNIKIDVEMGAYLLRKVEIKPTITLKELKEEMQLDLPDKPYVNKQAISKHLNDQLDLQYQRCTISALLSIVKRQF